jgi:hypothetical protein
MKKIIYTLGTLAFLAGCAPFKLSVSDELKNDHDEYAVKGRQGILINQKLSFGDYKTTKVKRSWTKGTSSRFGIGTGGVTQADWMNLISLEYIDKKQTVNFSLTDGSLNSEVFCVSRFKAQDLQIGKSENSILNIGLDLSGAGGSSSSLYYVQIYTQGDGGVPWQLVLDNQRSQSQAKHYVGLLGKSKTDYYTIHPITKLEKNGKSGNILAGSVGYEIKNASGRSIAAVSLMDKGVVYLGKTTAEERFLLANLSAAILLQQQID